MLYLQQAEQSLDRLDRAVEAWNRALQRRGRPGRGRAALLAPASPDRSAMQAALREARAALAEMARLEPPPGLEAVHRSWLELVARYERGVEALERCTVQGNAPRELEQFTLEWAQADQIEDEWRAAVQAAAQ
jgi:hypothetical protein